MKKKGLIYLMIVIMLILPINVFAENNIKKSSLIEDLNNNNGISIEYEKDKQKVLDNTPEIGCKSAYVAEPTTGKVIYEKNAHQKMYPASTTKILTALVAMEKCDLTEKAKVSKKALALVPAGYSNAKLQVGEEISISDLLYALLIPSANEAANVLAEHISGSIENFAKLCNKRAKELGCEQLHFVNANGMHDTNHYCSAYDLYLIAKECQKHEIFNEIVKTRSYTVPATNIYKRQDRVLKNTNSLIQPTERNYYYPYCTGIKTGHTTPAGECLVASSSYNDIDLISVVLGGSINSKGLNERFSDTKNLFEFFYDNYTVKEIINQKKAVVNLNVNHATKDTASLDVIAQTNIETIVPNKLKIDDIQKNIQLDENISAPIKQNQVLGKVTINADGLNYTVNLIASHPVEKIPYWIYNSTVIGIIFFFIIILVAFKKRHSSIRE